MPSGRKGRGIFNTSQKGAKGERHRGDGSEPPPGPGSPTQGVSSDAFDDMDRDLSAFLAAEEAAVDGVEYMED